MTMEIARRLGRNVMTISREKEHGTVRQIDTLRTPYKRCFANVGARVYKKNRKNFGAHSTVNLPVSQKKRLKQKWLLDAPVGYAKKDDKL